MGRVYNENREKSYIENIRIINFRRRCWRYYTIGFGLNLARVASICGLGGFTLRLQLAAMRQGWVEEGKQFQRRFLVPSPLRIDYPDAAISPIYCYNHRSCDCYPSFQYQSFRRESQNARADYARKRGDGDLEVF